MIGLKKLDAPRGTSRVSLVVKPELENRRDMAHGGVIASMIDIAAGIAVQSQIGVPDSTITTNMQVYFLRPGKGNLIATGRVGDINGSVAVGLVEVHDEQGNLLALGSGTFVIRLPTGDQ